MERNFTEKVTKHTTPTAGETLPDGVMLELIHPEGSAGKPKLLVWRAGEKTQVVDVFQSCDRLYLPASVNSSTTDAILFPSQATGYGSAEELFARIPELAKHYFSLPDRDLGALAYWAFASWFPELPVPATLGVTAPSPVEALAFLRFVRCICRRGLLLTEIEPAGFLAIPRQLKPTLLIHQTRLTRRMRALLRAASGRGALVTARGRFLDVRGAMAIFCNDLNLDPTEDLLRITVGPAEPNSAHAFDGRAEASIAAEMQAKLLKYRLENHKVVLGSTVDAPDFTAGVRDLARTLAASVASDADLAHGAISLLCPIDEDARARWTTLPEFAIVVALLALLHERKEPQLLVKELTDFVNTALRAGGEFVQFSPEEVGHRLAALNLYRGRTAAGKVLRLTRELSVQVHGLKRVYGVKTSPANFPGCPDCEQPQVTEEKQPM